MQTKFCVKQIINLIIIFQSKTTKRIKSIYNYIFIFNNPLFKQNLSLTYKQNEVIWWKKSNLHFLGSFLKTIEFYIMSNKF